ncbi:MAG: hypothetical protein FJ246_04320, partial [Nitrospira sp.]|nr:hypothetical protein [Nitrospira sp.]
MLRPTVRRSALCAYVLVSLGFLGLLAGCTGTQVSTSGEDMAFGSPKGMKELRMVDGEFQLVSGSHRGSADEAAADSAR